ncbi:Uncharacterized SPBc2 prophage-derived protein YoqJ [Bhargavaea beijingensis]|uniref:UPF0398 protein SAMN04488126_11322 n=2 Tax=Bhargavaea beijingensis TaxID=426756 RepID=A0A1G7ECZ0_9BACL|nr:Uncharacterized SPBc2 prophage-derived protein YoqJ [Bhargavaea beijingensis]
MTPTGQSVPRTGLFHLYPERMTLMLKRLLVSGYKPHELGIFNDKHPGIAVIRRAITSRLRGLLEEEGLEWVIVSGQPGVETWAAEAAFELRQEYPDLKVAVITPFLEQEKNWNDSKKMAYESILEQADFTTVLMNRPYEGPWQFSERDKFLLRNSDGLMLVYDEENEGSPRWLRRLALSSAEHGPYEFFTISAEDLNFAAEEMRMEEEGW